MIIINEVLITVQLGKEIIIIGIWKKDICEPEEKNQSCCGSQNDAK